MSKTLFYNAFLIKYLGLITAYYTFNLVNCDVPRTVHCYNNASSLANAELNGELSKLHIWRELSHMGYLGVRWVKFDLCSCHSLIILCSLSSTTRYYV